MRVLRLLGTAAILGLVAAGAWVRLAPLDAGTLHVDPLTVTARGSTNGWLAAPEGDAPPLRVDLDPTVAAARVAEVILGTPRTTLLAGGDDWATYVTRSALWGFPDIASVRITPAGEGAEVAVYSRARFGRSDLGVNRARVEGWRAALGAAR